MRGMISSGIISPITGTLVSSSLSYVLDQTNFREKVLEYLGDPDTIARIERQAEQDRIQMANAANGVAAGGDEVEAEPEVKLLSNTEKHKVEREENEKDKIKQQAREKQQRAVRLADKRAGKAKITDEEVDTNANDIIIEDKLSYKDTEPKLKPAKLTRRNSDPGLVDNEQAPINKLSFLKQLDYFVRGDSVLDEEQRKEITADREKHSDSRSVQATGGLLGPAQRWLVEKTTGVNFNISNDPTESIGGTRLALGNDKPKTQQATSSTSSSNNNNNSTTSNLPALFNQNNININTTKKVQGAKASNYPGELVISNAREVVVTDPLITRRYVRQIENITQKAVTLEQVNLLKNSLKTQEFKKLDITQKDAHRVKFDNIRKKLIMEWEQNTGKEWPKYKENIGVKKVGNLYDAHHIIQLDHGGPNTWWNIHPAHGLTEHKAIHSSGSFANEIFKHKKK